MTRKIYIFVLTFLCLLCGEMGYAGDVYRDENTAKGGVCDLDSVDYNFCICNGLPENCETLDEVIIYPKCDQRNPNYYNNICECEPEWCDSGDCTDSSSLAFPCVEEEDTECSEFGEGAYMTSCGCIGGETGIDECPEDDTPIDSQDPPAEPDPCSEAEIAAGVATTNLFKYNAVSTTMSQMPILFPSNQPPYSQQLEHGFNIKSVNGIISTTPIREGTATGLPAADYTASVIADLHDHPAPGTFAPSARDLLGLDNRRDLMSGFTTSYVSSSDGNLYALYIDDPAKLNAFVDNNPGFVDSYNNFNKDTNIGKMFWDTNDDLQRQGYTSQEAYTRATTLILQDAGVSLLKSDAKTIDFKKIDIIVVGDDPNGNTIIIINDCK
jgi:hypothetical protein